ncbi:hypothetical protein E0K83_03750 [Gramella sp. BOM4]|nr:hypothetical protein [Christiangramia bathymodioli]
MITKVEGNYIKEILGSNYLKKISERLIDKNVTNQKGGDISNPFICMMLNGKRKHEAAEKEIRDLTEETVDQQEQDKERLEKVYQRHKALKK